MPQLRRRSHPQLAASAFLALLVLTSVAATAREEAPIGRVKTTDGEAFLISGEQRNAAQIGAPVYPYDALETGVDGSLGIVFQDESRVSLGPDTQLVVDEFVFDPQQDRLSFVSRMTRGTLLFVSGLIAKLSPGSTEVRTPAGILGVRGTKFLVRLDRATAE